MNELRAGRQTKRFRFWERTKAFFLRLSQNPDQERRAIAGFVGAIGLAALVLGYFGIRQNLREPYAFLYKDIPQEELDAFRAEINAVFNREQAGLKELQGKDTDGDGLNDYEELYVYATSPYLSDTDGDTFTDSQEILSGNDPNCPADEVCAGRIEPAAGDLPDPETATAEQVRAVLLEAGIDQASIDLLSDDDLIALYKETIDATGLDNAKITPDTIVDVLSQDQGTLTAVQITADELRDLLLLTGEISAEDLAGVTDEELMAVYGQVVQDELGSVINNNQNTNQGE